VLDIAAIAMFGPMASDDTDFVNPLNPSARADPLAFGSVVGVSVMHEVEQFDGSSDEYMAMSGPEQVGEGSL
jgi:hypothetical protein